MTSRHTEAAFETVIESHLLANGYILVDRAGFDQERAIFSETVLAFIRETQPAEWGRLAALHGEKTGEQVLDELNLELEARYAANRQGITRQLRFSPRSEKSLDVTLSLNGIPVATIELKNPLTGQTVDNALYQYRHDRDPREPIFEFKRRTLVHFAADTECVRMTARLAGEATHFLPFDKGWEGGAGKMTNPASPCIGASLPGGLCGPYRSPALSLFPESLPHDIL